MSTLVKCELERQVTLLQLDSVRTTAKIINLKIYTGNWSPPETTLVLATPRGEDDGLAHGCVQRELMSFSGYCPLRQSDGLCCLVDEAHPAAS